MRQEPGKEGMVICSGCDEGFHFSCHSPRLSERVKNSKWFCHKCSLLQAKSSPVHVPVRTSVLHPMTPSQNANKIANPHFQSRVPCDYRPRPRPRPERLVTMYRDPVPGMSKEQVQVKGVAPPRESSIPDSIVKKYLAPPDPLGAMDSDEPIDERIPDASGWSVDQVEEYLIEQGLPDQAAVFKEHV
ncbi:unnamed protein product [Timema podura]|uniref:Zinc finger PHD-type domain-containing protein n=1 Tax=Timema podura TaxID=61482 RepID=A0ABN7NYF6_TIMPD|nr:unnamed protein product [Timema podura]